MSVNIKYRRAKGETGKRERRKHREWVKKQGRESPLQMSKILKSQSSLKTTLHMVSLKIPQVRVLLCVKYYKEIETQCRPQK